MSVASIESAVEFHDWLTVVGLLEDILHKPDEIVFLPKLQHSVGLRLGALLSQFTNEAIEASNGYLWGPEVRKLVQDVLVEEVRHDLPTSNPLARCLPRGSRTIPAPPAVLSTSAVIPPWMATFTPAYDPAATIFTVLAQQPPLDQIAVDLRNGDIAMNAKLLYAMLTGCATVAEHSYAWKKAEFTHDGVCWQTPFLIPRETESPALVEHLDDACALLALDEESLLKIQRHYQYQFEHAAFVNPLEMARTTWGCDVRVGPAPDAVDTLKKEGYYVVASPFLQDR